jgi:hypothetical protein
MWLASDIYRVSTPNYDNKHAIFRRKKFTLILVCDNVNSASCDNGISVNDFDERFGMVGDRMQRGSSKVCREG